MGILNLFRTKSPDLDQLVLAQLQKASSNLAKPHAIEFFLYFPSQSVAEQAAPTIREAGFEVNVQRAPQGDQWLCFAKRTMVPELQELQKIRRNFATLATSLKGDYDGWGTEVVN